MTAKVRLNDNTRYKIIEALSGHALMGRERVLFERERDLFLAARKEMVEPAVLKKVMSLPPEWQTQGHQLTVNANGWVVQLSHRDLTTHSPPSHGSYWGGSGSFCQTSDLPMPVVDRQNHFVVSSALAERIQTYEQDVKVGADERRQLYAEICSLVNSFKTVQEALAAIPELKDICPDSLVIQQNAIVPVAKQIMCKIASIRGEEREGCGEPEKLAA